MSRGLWNRSSVNIAVFATDSKPWSTCDAPKRNNRAELSRRCYALPRTEGNQEFALNSNDASPARDYFRRDQRDGVSPPDLSKDCTFAEHIVHARGKRTQFTSVSLDLSKIRDFGDTYYKLERDKTVSHGHSLLSTRHCLLSSDEVSERLNAKTVTELLVPWSMQRGVRKDW